VIEPDDARRIIATDADAEAIRFFCADADETGGVYVVDEFEVKSDA
jgi:hypothetical protein